MGGAFGGLVDATDVPFAAVADVVRADLVDPGAESGRAEPRGITNRPRRITDRNSPWRRF